MLNDFYSRWCEARNCDHAHCPHGCEHPQPFGAVLNGEVEEKLLCGRCWVIEGRITEMTACTPDVCE